jgi:glycine/D-amino acid oxidase-like deaminating enzyme
MAKIVIIGGGVIGSSVAYYLALAGHAADVIVIEPDPTYEFAAPRAPPAASGNCLPCPRTSAWRSTGTRSTASSRR